MHLRGNWLIFLGILGKAELILRFWGAKERELMNFGRSVHYFQGSREHRPPGGLNSNQPLSVAPRSFTTREGLFCSIHAHSSSNTNRQFFRYHRVPVSGPP